MICVVWVFINPNNDVDVVFKLVICVVCPFINNFELVENYLNY